MENARPEKVRRPCAVIFHYSQSEADAFVTVIPCRQSGCTAHSAIGHWLTFLIDQTVSIRIHKRQQIHDRIGRHDEIPVHAF